MFDPRLLEPLLVIMVPVLYVMGAVIMALAAYRKMPASNLPISGFAFLAAVSATVSSWWWPGTASWLNLTPLAYVMLLLITSLGLILARFSMRYLSGSRGQARFMACLLLILACVSLIVTTNHLLVFLGSWITISITLHQLLTFFPKRPRAALAAHKKFIFARLAEFCLALAFALLYVEYQTLFFDEMLSRFSQGNGLPMGVQAAGVLMALAALLKCAQLPFHGWLIQVVETPTPVSALLHAGVVNLGGFLMILMAPMVSEIAAAQWLLLLVAGPTAVFASLVMMTRISVKVRLAWSTCAQMGWMLVECALGLYELALLHLVAHSGYKAHAFLSAGSAVELALGKRLVSAREPEFKHGLSAAFLAVVFVAGSAAVSASSEPAQMFAWVVPGLALAILLSERFAAGGGVIRIIQSLLIGAAFWGIYWAQKAAFQFLQISPEGDVSYVAIGFVTVLIAALLVGYYLVRYHRFAPSGMSFYRFLFAAGYLDEWSTRLTLKIWPAKLPDVVQPRRTATISSSVDSKESR